MKKCSRFLVLLFSLSFLTVAGTAHAYWFLDNDESTVSFVTVKADHVAEVHTFDVLSGEIDDNGAVEISIELASVNTLIPIRNERMQAMLFETNLFPRADIKASIDLTSLEAMEPGTSETMPLNFSLEMHGASRSYSAEVKVTRLHEGLLASTVKPIVIIAEDFDLVSGVEALREVAGLPGISRAVPVSFTVQFNDGR